MPSLKDIKNSIASVKATQKITKAMKMISTARLTKSKIILQNHKEYSNAINEIAKSTISHFNNDTLDIPKFLENFTVKVQNAETLTVLISTDKGLCGALNTFLFKEFQANVLKTDNIIVIGKKAFDYAKNKVKILNSTPYFAGKVENHQKIIADILNIVKEKNIGKIKIIFPEFISVMVQKPKTLIFPEKIKNLGSPPQFVVEGCQIMLTTKIIEEAISSLIQQGISQMMCSEHSARMIAMDNASNNASTRIKALTLAYNKTRQANITREILEIVAGSQAI